MLVWNYANRVEFSPVRENRRLLIKGIGNSITIAFDVEDKGTAHLVLLSLTETGVYMSTDQSDLGGRTFPIKIAGIRPTRAKMAATRKESLMPSMVAC